MKHFYELPLRLKQQHDNNENEREKKRERERDRQTNKTKYLVRRYANDEESNKFTYSQCVPQQAYIKIL